MAKLKKISYYNNLTNKVITTQDDFKIQLPQQGPTGRGIFDFDIKPGARFFYFISLLDYAGKKYPGYNNLMSYGQNSFDIEHQQTLNNDQWQEKMQAILSVIHGFKQYEANNERMLFEQKLKPVLEADPEKYNEFMNIFQDDSVDYIRFMALLKILNNDIKTIEHLTSNMSKQMHLFNKTYNLVLDSKIREEKQEYKTNRYNMNFSFRDRTVEDTREILKQHDIVTNEMTDIFKSLLIDAHKIEKSQDKGEKIELSQLNNIVISMIQNGQSSLAGDNIPKSLTNTQDKALKLALYQKIRQYAAARGKSARDIIDRIERIILNWNTFMNEEEKQDTQNLTSDLNKYLFTCLQQLDDITQQWEQVQSVMNSDHRLTYRKSGSDQIAGLIKSRRQKIIQAIAENPRSNKKALKELQKIQDSNKIINQHTGQIESFDIRKKEHFNQYISILKKAMNTQKNLENLLDTLNVIVTASEAKKSTELITIASETGGLLDLRNMGDFVAKVVGKEGLREDSFLIGYAKYTKDDPLDSDLIKALDSAAQFRANKAIPLMKKETRNYNKKYNQDYGQNAYDTMGTTLAAIKLDEITAEHLQKQLKLPSLAAAYNELKNLIVVEPSTKFATTFNTTEFGFSGGSLGADLFKQIQNINEMMILGGISPIDQDFLISAIMNAGPGMLGYNQKDKIEMYLSSLASICMFSSGGQSLLNYTNEVQRHLESLGSTKIHIFNVGTLYVPLSYILSLMETGMQRCLNILNSSILNETSGNKVNIYNPVNENTDKISTKYVGSNGEEFYMGDWYATAAAGLPKVTLNMAILGSYLDVLDSINKILQNMI